MMGLAMNVAFPRSSAPAPLEASILARCRSRDPMAFRAFVVRYERMVFALLSRILVGRHDVEDLAQETFVRAYRAFPDFDPEGPAKVSTWLLTIATRLALDTRKKKTLSGSPIADDLPTSQPSPEDEMSRRQLGRAIERAAAALPDDQRAAFVLAEYHGVAIADIAHALSVPENTVKTRLFRAREKMREALAREWRTP